MPSRQFKPYRNPPKPEQSGFKQTTGIIDQRLIEGARIPSPFEHRVRGSQEPVGYSGAGDKRYMSQSPSGHAFARKELETIQLPYSGHTEDDSGISQSPSGNAQAATELDAFGK